jgi:hypothetical protein
MFADLLRRGNIQPAKWGSRMGMQQSGITSRQQEHSQGGCECVMAGILSAHLAEGVFEALRSAAGGGNVNRFGGARDGEGLVRT